MKKSELTKVIRESLELDEEPQDLLNEAYMAQGKSYHLNTEMLLNKTKEAHKELYHKYIADYNETSARLDTVDKRASNANFSDFRSLKLAEQYNANAVYLHELYFANISDPYSEVNVDSLAHMRLNRDFGSFDNWQMDFMACAMSCRNGWVITALSPYLKRYVNMIVDSHDLHSLIGAYPLIVLDLWEHARRDYLNNKKDYITAMMRELNWNVINKRFERAEEYYKALMGGKSTWA